MRAYVDIDDTLVTTLHRSLSPEVVVRPSAMAFLEALQAKGVELYAHSYGDRDRQRQLLRTVGLLDLFVDVHGRDDTPGRPACPWVLVDNEDPVFDGLKHKLLQLGQEPTEEAWERHFVQCADWLGEDDHEPLTTLLPGIMGRLSLQADGGD